MPRDPRDRDRRRDYEDQPPRRVPRGRPASPLLKGSIGAVVGLVGFSLCCCGVFFGYGRKGEGDRPANARPEKEAPRPPVVTVTPHDLIAAYEGNEVAGDNAYKNMRIGIKGPVTRVGTDLLGEPYVIMSTGRFVTVQCMFGSDRDAVSGLRPGDQITIWGRCKGKFGNIIVRECVVAPGN